MKKMDRVSFVMMISFFTNLFLAGMKVVVGLIGSSHALIADGIHSFSDLVTDIVAIIGSFFARKPADLKHPYGHGRMEYLTSMVIGIVIFILGGSIIYNSFFKEIIIPSTLVIVISFFTIFIKYLLSTYLKKNGEKLQNSILLASSKESKTDCLSSIIVLLSSICMQFSKQISFLQYADQVASIIVGFFIVHVGLSILKENVSVILGEQEMEQSEDLRNLLFSDEKVKRIDKIILIKYGSYYRLNLEVSLDFRLSLLESHEIAHNLEAKIKEKNEKIRYVFIHVNPYIEN